MNVAMTNLVGPAVMDRAIGAVVASAVGDGLGAPYEFGPPDAAAPCAMEGGGGFRWEPGEWTDDTQMALAILDVLARGRADAAEIGDGMLRWFASAPRDVGNQTRAVLGAAIRDGVPPVVAAAAFQARQPDAAGNGALMRTGPVASAAIGDRQAVAALAAEVAALTHPHVDSVDACVLWSLAIERAIVTARSDRPFDWCGAVRVGLDHIDPARRGRWSARIDEADGADPATLHRQNGWVVGAFQAALACITSAARDDHRVPSDHLAAALRLAARSGGDTDTVAAIAGSLLGARWGATAIPLHWRRRLHGRRTYSEAVVSGAELEALARLAARRGAPDAQGWPGVATMAYRPSTPRHVELDGAWFGNVGGLGAAVAAGATVVVSLCRMGVDDVPASVEHHTIGLIDSEVGDNPNVAHVLFDAARTIADLVDRGERVFVHCVHAEHRAPAMAAAYLVVRGADHGAAIRRASEALGGRPRPFMRDALVEVQRLAAVGR